MRNFDHQTGDIGVGLVLRDGQGSKTKQTTLDGEVIGELEEKTIKKIVKVRDRVEYLFQQYPSTKGNRNELIFRYYRVFEPWLGIKLRDFNALLEMTSPETIRRRAQEFNERGEYLPSIKVQTRRKRLSEIPQGMI